MKKLDRSALRLIGGLTDREIDTLERSSARQRSKKKALQKHLNPGEQRTQTEIFSGEGSRDMWDAINSLKRFYTNGTRRGTDFDQTWNALYTIGCKLQEFESFVRNHIKEEKPTGKQRKDST